MENQQKNNEEFPAVDTDVEMMKNYPVKEQGIIRKFDLLGEDDVKEAQVDVTEADRRKEKFMEELKLNYPNVYWALKAEEDGKKESI